MKSSSRRCSIRSGTGTRRSTAIYASQIRPTFNPETLGGSPVTIHIYVDDADTLFKRAVAAGANVTMPLEDMFWGDRYGKLEDPFGHKWSIASRIENLSAEEIVARAPTQGG